MGGVFLQETFNVLQADIGVRGTIKREQHSATYGLVNTLARYINAEAIYCLAGNGMLDFSITTVLA